MERNGDEREGGTPALPAREAVDGKRGSKALGPPLFCSSKRLQGKASTGGKKWQRRERRCKRKEKMRKSGEGHGCEVHPCLWWRPA